MPSYSRNRMRPKKASNNPSGYGKTVGKGPSGLGGTKGLLSAYAKMGVRTGSLYGNLTRLDKRDKAYRGKGKRKGKPGAKGGNYGGAGGGKDQGPGGNQGPVTPSGTPQPEAWASGVSASTLEFVKEKAQSRLASGEAEEGKQTKHKNKHKPGAGKKKQKGKLVKRASKKSGVNAKKLRKALRTQGISAKEKALYKRVGQASNPKLSHRLRMADRRNDKKKKGKK